MCLFYVLNVMEGILVGIIMGTVIVVDGDTGRNVRIRYGIVGDYTDVFFIDSLSGNLKVVRRFDWELVEVYILNIFVVD